MLIGGSGKKDHELEMVEVIPEINKRKTATNVLRHSVIITVYI